MSSLLDLQPFRPSRPPVLIVAPMFSRSPVPRDGPMTTSVPTAAADRPSWVKVGVIAAVGFAVGIAWPRLAGVRLGPNAPETAAAAAPASASPAASDSALSVQLPPPPVPSAVPTAAPGPALPTVTVGKAFVLSCKTDDGATLKSAECGGFSFDSVALPRLKKLEKCTAADGISGKLGVVLNVDFESSHIGVDNGKATNIPSSEPLFACVRDAFNGVPLGGVEHQHPRYSIAYTLSLAAPPSAATAAQAATTAGGDETPGVVVWDAAIVRDAPRSKTALARLPRGTKIMVGPGKDNWYKIKYGADFGSEGYVFRAAIGK
jgi:hypothetical protein